ncbi:hypothetical protein LPTSP4_25340 [Leptospira ryugenii]|uniref:Uncharacterized protein n=1 Tax=Leptospira ryugenii TaxID=1917863 RepID=A0A2P2E277_9LEPT|nr:hypothetical protein [Leptospira ryugenii]GBF51003.1 hypothetical protein LPTSP4_25340 [Leptospira ryugenii]
MSSPLKKVTQSKDFFTEKIRLEQAVIDLEKMIMETDPLFQKIDHSLLKMKEIADQNDSTYFLQRVKKLDALIHALKIKKHYAKDEFDGIYHTLEKIRNEDRIEFLDSALKNRIAKVAKNLQKADPELPTQDLKHKTRYTIFKTDGVLFLLPYQSFKILRQIPAYKSHIVLNGRKIPLFPGKGFAIDDQDKSKQKKNVLLITNAEQKMEAFYFDELLEDWAVSHKTIESLLEKTSSHKMILGKIKRAGRYYHLIRST